MKSVAAKETTMQTILTSTVAKLFALAVVAAAIGGLVGARTSERGLRVSSAPISQRHRPSSVCGTRSGSRPQFVKISVRASADRRECRPKYVLV
jgi:hypothetical protein